MQRPEQELVHKPVVEHLRTRGVPGLLFWHTPQGVKYGGRRNRKGINIQGAIMKGLGARAGVSDILALHDGKFYALELKADGGRASEHQLEFIADVEAAGGFTCIAEGLDEALKALEAWGLLRGTANGGSNAIMQSSRVNVAPTEPQSFAV